MSLLVNALFLGPCGLSAMEAAGLLQFRGDLNGFVRLGQEVVSRLAPEVEDKMGLRRELLGIAQASFVDDTRRGLRNVAKRFREIPDPLYTEAAHAVACDREVLIEIDGLPRRFAGLFRETLPRRLQWGINLSALRLVFPIFFEVEKIFSSIHGVACFADLHALTGRLESAAGLYAHEGDRWTRLVLAILIVMDKTLESDPDAYRRAREKAAHAARNAVLAYTRGGHAEKREEAEKLLFRAERKKPLWVLLRDIAMGHGDPESALEEIHHRTGIPHRAIREGLYARKKVAALLESAGIPRHNIEVFFTKI